MQSLEEVVTLGESVVDSGLVVVLIRVVVVVTVQVVVIVEMVRLLLIADWMLHAMGSAVGVIFIIIAIIEEVVVVVGLVVSVLVCVVLSVKEVVVLVMELVVVLLVRHRVLVLVEAVVLPVSDWLTLCLSLWLPTLGVVSNKARLLLLRSKLYWRPCCRISTNHWLLGKSLRSPSPWVSSEHGAFSK